MNTKNRPLPQLLRLAILAALPAIALAVMLATGNLTSRAVQNASISIDMVTTGNSYTPGDDLDANGFPDPGTNHMTVGTIDPCLTTVAPGSNVVHNHTTHLIIQNVEDLIAWQVRFNYLGDQMRPSTFNATPFTDSFTGDPVGFANLPFDTDSGQHRSVIPASAIPAAATGPQTALIGAVYNGAQNAWISPDTPAKTPPDNTSYSTTGGGILATLTLQVLAGNAGNPSLFMNLDDDSPNPPESGYTYFNGTGTTTIQTPVTQLGDGYHGEGAACVPLDCVNPECPVVSVTPEPTEPPTPTPPPPTPTPTPPPATPTPGPRGSFNPQVSATYCEEGTGDIDDQQLTVSCTPDANAGSHADVVSAFNINAPDYNLAGIVGLSQTVPDDTAIPVGAVLGRLGSQPTLGLLNNTCSNSQLRVPFTFLKATTDINNTVQPQPFGESNDLAIMAGDNPPYNGQQDVKPAPAVTKYPSFLNAIFDHDWADYGPDKIAGNADDNNGPQPPIQPVFRAVGTSSISSASNQWLVLQLVVFAPGTDLPNLPPLDPSLGYPSVAVVQQTSAAGSATPPAKSPITDFCSALKTVSVSYGVTKDNPDTPANEGGIPVRTLPAPGTEIRNTVWAFSQRDADRDGIENTFDTCPFHADWVWNPRDDTFPIEGDSDQFVGTASPDGIPDTCDPTPNNPTADPPAQSPTDHDGDGFPNRGDNCPLHANSDQADRDRNAAGEEVGDGIGDVCDTPGTNPGTDSGGRPIPGPRTVSGNGPLVPDGASINCVRTLTVTVGGPGQAVVSACNETLPPPPTPSPTPTPPPTPSPTPTPIPTPSGLFHDAAVKRLRGPSSVRLSSAVPDNGIVTVVAGNAQSDHADTVGIYLALLPPGGTSNFGGCSPAGVLNLGSLTLLPGSYVTLKTQPSWQCANPGAVDGMAWTLKAVADVHGDDFGSCSTLSQMFSGECAAALASDDSDDFNSSSTRPRPIVVATGP